MFFFLTLACMAGFKRGRGRGDLGAAPKFPLPLLTPATQAPLTSTDIDGTNGNLFLTLLVCFPFKANEALLGRPCTLILCLNCKNSCFMHLGLGHIFVPIQPIYMSFVTITWIRDRRQRKLRINQVKNILT